jgi:hypothetical protein
MLSKTLKFSSPSVLSPRTFFFCVISILMYITISVTFRPRSGYNTSNARNVSDPGSTDNVRRLISRSKLSSHLLPDDGNILIAERMCKNISFVAGRVGDAEAYLVEDFLAGGRIRKRAQPQMHSGIYPETQEGLFSFSTSYARALNSLSAPDLLAVATHRRGTEVPVFSRTVSASVEIIHSRALEPFYFPREPWSRCLEGKTVLIVHPFADSVKCQLGRSHILFPGTNILPSFNAKVVKAFQCLGRGRLPHRNWQETFDAMTRLVDDVGHFDVAIIGAGSYGLPLAVWCKERKGASAVVVGGATQLLFGLKGRRWDSHPILKLLYNAAWIYPLAADTISDANKIEQGGPYWGRGTDVLKVCPPVVASQSGETQSLN